MYLVFHFRAHKSTWFIASFLSDRSLCLVSRSLFPTYHRVYLNKHRALKFLNSVRKIALQKLLFGIFYIITWSTFIYDEIGSYFFQLDYLNQRMLFKVQTVFNTFQDSSRLQDFNQLFEFPVRILFEVHWLNRMLSFKI